MVWGWGLGTGQQHSQLKEKVLENQGDNTGLHWPCDREGLQSPRSWQDNPAGSQALPFPPHPTFEGGTGIQVGYTVGPLKSSFEEDATQPQAPWLFLSFVSP